MKRGTVEERVKEKKRKNTQKVTSKEAIGNTCKLGQFRVNIPYRFIGTKFLIVCILIDIKPHYVICNIYKRLVY